MSTLSVKSEGGFSAHSLVSFKPSLELLCPLEMQAKSKAQYPGTSLNNAVYRENINSPWCLVSLDM